MPGFDHSIMTSYNEIRESVTFGNGGKKLFGVLHRPKLTISASSYPAVVVMHGFASHKIGTNRIYVKLAQSLANQGIAALRFDFRGFRR